MSAAGPPDVMVVSRVVLDVIEDAGPGVRRTVLGGSGFWAAFGAATVSDDVALASRVGTDFARYRPALGRLGIRSDALVVDGRTTSTTLIAYPDGERRVETPLPDWDAHVRMRAVLDDIPHAMRAAGAYYVFRGRHPGFWPPLLAHVAATRVPMLWELPSEVCAPGHRERVQEVLVVPAIVSLNIAEAAALLRGVVPGDAPAGRLARAVLELGAKVVVLRCGGEGSVVATAEESLLVGVAPDGVVRDVTGAGNAYSGAFLAAWRAKGDLAAAAVAGGAAAGVAIETVGPPHDLVSARRRAAELAATIVVRPVRP
jgi:sugar/nucleoside kinase (ribokinase family)